MKKVIAIQTSASDKEYTVPDDAQYLFSKVYEEGIRTTVLHFFLVKA